MRLSGIQGFEWNEGNREKNEKKHGVTSIECEEVFFNKPLVIARSLYSEGEERYVALGKTHGGRLLFLVFAIRNQRIRIISARPMSRKERKTYEKEDKT